MQLGRNPNRQENKETLDTYEIIEQILLFGPFVLPYDRSVMTGLPHGLQVICTARNQQDEPCEPREVSDESEHPGKRSEKRRYGDGKGWWHFIPASIRSHCPVGSPSRSISEPPPNAMSVITSYLSH